MKIFLIIVGFATFTLQYGCAVSTDSPYSPCSIEKYFSFDNNVTCIYSRYERDSSEAGVVERTAIDTAEIRQSRHNNVEFISIKFRGDDGKQESILLTPNNGSLWIHSTSFKAVKDPCLATDWLRIISCRVDEWVDVDTSYVADPLPTLDSTGNILVIIRNVNHKINGGIVDENFFQLGKKRYPAIRTRINLNLSYKLVSPENEAKNSESKIIWPGTVDFMFADHLGFVKWIQEDEVIYKNTNYPPVKFYENRNLVGKSHVERVLVEYRVN